MKPKRSVRDATVRGHRVLVRVDFNVPQTPDGQVADDRRIAEAIPTIDHLRTAGARVILLSHLGRPGGTRDGRLSLRPVVRRLAALLGQPVAFADDAVGIGALTAATRLQNGDVLLLENLRFHSGEEANDPGFAAALAQLGDVFVEEAFGTVHRAHASTVGIARRLPSYAGFLVEREMRELSRLTGEVERPYAVLVGGAKVADKLPLLTSFIGRADRVLIGGALAFPFLRAQGASLGRSPVESGLEEDVRKILEGARERRTQVVLPTDLTTEDEGKAEVAVYPAGKLPSTAAARDIGPETRAAFVRALEGTQTVFWNGPLGLAEDPRFSAGTREVLMGLAGIPGYHVGAGGDSARLAQELGVTNALAFLSTGGGAALEFVEGRELPGLAVLPDA